MVSIKLKKERAQKFEMALPINGLGSSTRVYISNKLNSFNYSGVLDILGLISSFCSIYPAGPGKFSMISWFVNQNSETLTLLYPSILAEIILIFVASFGFVYFFVISKRENFFLNEVLPFFLKLNIYRKIAFASFTFFAAIPNKFWINSQINFIPLFLISCFIYCLGFIFPILFFCYIMYLFLCLESFIFAILYENIKPFKQTINYLLFGNSDHPFAEKYFSWFWGNMWRAATDKAAKVSAALVATEAKRQHENQQRNDYADKHTSGADKTKEGFKTPQERADFHKDRRDEWTEENGLVTKAIKWGQDFFSGSS